MKHKGFTVVELIVIIVVISILAVITIAAHSYMRADAMDSKIKAAVDSIGDALVLYETQGGKVEELPEQPPVHKYYDIKAKDVDKLVPKYLKADYRDGLVSSQVDIDSETIGSQTVFDVYRCQDGAFLITAKLNNPSRRDKESFPRNVKACDMPEWRQNNILRGAQEDTSGWYGVTSYAKLF